MRSSQVDELEPTEIETFLVCERVEWCVGGTALQLCSLADITGFPLNYLQ